MLVSLASIIVSLVFSVNGYNKAKNDENLVQVSKYLNTVYILLACAVALLVIGLLVGLFGGSLSGLGRSGLLAGGLLSSLVTIVFAVLLIAALVYSLLAYNASVGTGLETETLISALALTIGILSTLFSSVAPMYAEKWASKLKGM
jgi:heme/copper-type cytochrome/quinol oxidase subunit 2